MRNRIIAIVLVVALIPCLLAVPAVATSVEDDNFLHVLDYPNPVSATIDSSNTSVSFSLPNFNTMHYIDVLLVMAGDVPSSVSCTFQGHSFALSILPIDIGHGLYRLQGSLGGYSTDSFSLDFVPSGTSWLTFKSIKVSTLFADYLDISSSATVYVSHTGSSHNFTYTPGSLDNFYVSHFTGSYDNASWYFSLEPTDYQKYDAIEYLLVLDKVDIDSLSATYNGVQLPISYSFINDLNSSSPYTLVSLHVDLSDVVFKSSMDPFIIITGTFNIDSSYTFAILDCKGLVYTEDVNPVLFYLRSIIDSISSWGLGIINSISSWSQNIVNSVVTWGQNIVNAIINPDGSDELSQAGNDLSNSAGDINSAGDVLGSVDQPDVNTGDLIGGLTNFDTGGLRILSCLTSNAQVTQMMIVVFTFCLAGYIFFGKKG